MSSDSGRARAGQKLFGSVGELLGALWRLSQRWLHPSFLWARLTHNFLPKALALLVAMGLWYMTTSERRVLVEQGFDVPLNVRDRDTTLIKERRAVSNLLPGTVRVTLQGRPERLRELRASNIEALVDITSIPAGSFNRPIEVIAPLGTELVQKTPDRAQGFVDNEKSRNLPILVSAPAPSDNSLARYSVTPDTARVSGAGQTIANVAQLLTSPLALKPGETQQIPLLALDIDGQPLPDVRLTPSQATVHRLDTGSVPLRTVPVVLKAPPKGLKISSVELTPSRVRLVAAQSQLDQLSSVEGVVKYQVGSYTAAVKVQVPAGVQVLDSVQANLKVEKGP